MTNPELSISTTQQVGRLYQLPGGGYNKSISKQKAVKGIQDGTLVPSITNIISVLNKPSLQSYAVYMTLKALREGATPSDAGKEHIRFRDYASERGTSIHNLIDEYILSGAAKGVFLPRFRALPGWDKVQQFEGVGYMNAFINFCREYQPEFLRTETTVYGNTEYTLASKHNLQLGQRYNYAGTTDFTAYINGANGERIKVVGDWKCTSALHPESVAPQVSAVKNAISFYNEQTGQLEDWDEDSYDTAIAVRLCSDGTFEAKEADLTRGWNSFKNLRTLWDDYALGSEDMLTSLK
jgi:hypothetical protein